MPPDKAVHLIHPDSLVIAVIGDDKLGKALHVRLY
jgi:5,10-methenyltetrahydromethanopterin hydrogenase